VIGGLEGVVIGGLVGSVLGTFFAAWVIGWVVVTIFRFPHESRARRWVMWGITVLVFLAWLPSALRSAIYNTP
jgi:branched-subunit amino acid ABC-type transport system permease component